MFIALEEMQQKDLLDFMGYWSRLRQGAFAPSWKDFDLMALDPGSIPRVIVADVIYGNDDVEPTDCIIRFWGTSHTRRKGTDKTGKSVNGFPAFRGPRGYDEYLQVIQGRLPVASRDLVYLHDVGKKLIFGQTQVRVPLSNDGRRVDHVATLVAWEKCAFADERFSQVDHPWEQHPSEAISM